MAVYEYDSQNQQLNRIAGGTLFAEAPLGTVIASFLAVPPTGYIKGDNTTYTKADYPELYEKLPAVFKDTVNETFAIDLREVALKGIGLNSLATGHYSSTGLTLGQFIDDRLQDHNHNLGYGNSGTNTLLAKMNLEGTTKTGNVADGRKGATTEVKSVGVNYFIKAKQIGVPADFVDEVSKQLNWNYVGYLNGDPQYGTITLDSKYHEFMLEVQNASGNIFSAIYSTTRQTIGNVTQYLCVGNDSTIVTYVTNTRTLTFYRTASSNIRVYAR